MLRIIILNVSISHSDHSRSFEMTFLSRACVSQYSVETLCLYFVPFLIHNEILVESRDFFVLAFRSTPPVGSPRRNIAITFGTAKITVVRLLDW